MKPEIIVIDDEPAICESLVLALDSYYEVYTAHDPKQALELIKRHSIQVALIDIKLGAYDGIELLKEVKKIDNDIAVIMITAYGSIRSSVTAMKNGAFNYLSKPFDIEELQIFIKQALEFKELNERVNYLSDELKSYYQYGNMIGKSPEMKLVFEQIEKLKNVDVSVTILGESGTGKELVARALHFNGKRTDKNFVVVNCAAIPEGLLEEEFFGHKRGSFTGATSDKKGKFEIADKGTIFLDEIGDMPLSLQGKLLRVLEQKEVSPIGSNTVKKVDVRVIAATNRDLQKMVNEGKFREDLYYRLNVFEIKLPPLRERKQDIPLLCEYFIKKYNKEQGKNIQGISREAERALLTHDYPGNIRELSNIIEYAMIMADDIYIQLKDLPQQFQGNKKELLFTAPDEGLNLKQLERNAILRCLQKNNGNRRKTAQELGISERGLRNKINEYGLSEEIK